MITNRYNQINKEVLLKRYILIFTLALISCVGTNFIHSLTTQVDLDKNETNDSLENGVENNNDVVGIEQILSVKKINNLIS